MYRVLNRTKKLQKNTSLEVLDCLLSLPKIKKIECQIEDQDFVLQYYENKNRVSIQYKFKDHLAAGT
jgi:hypothetical protein